MAICLFTDFGAGDLYVGQVEAVLDRLAPGARVIHLLHEAPAYDIKAAAHLLAALATGLIGNHVVVGVVDPGVGTGRGAVVVRADRHWYVGPDNGLFSVVAARAAAERARYEAERAERRYRKVEPENRLVARTLESEWEKSLTHLKTTEDELARKQQGMPDRADGNAT